MKDAILETIGKGAIIALISLAVICISLTLMVKLVDPFSDMMTVGSSDPRETVITDRPVFFWDWEWKMNNRYGVAR